MIDRLIRKDLKGNGRYVIKAVYRNLSRDAEENHGRDSTSALPEYKFRAAPLD